MCKYREKDSAALLALLVPLSLSPGAGGPVLWGRYVGQMCVSYYPPAAAEREFLTSGSQGSVAAPGTRHVSVSVGLIRESVPECVAIPLRHLMSLLVGLSQLPCPIPY